MSARQLIVGLGSNLGARAAYLSAAVAILDAHPDVAVEARSSVVATPALVQPQPDFLNAAVRVRTTLAPEALLDVLLETERKLGRERHERWGARTIDLDVLWINGETVRTPRLEVPHPGLFLRSFALAPLLEVLDARDPAGPELRARAAALGVPRQVGQLGNVPTARITCDTSGEMLIETEPDDDTPDATARLLQALLDLLGGDVGFDGACESLGTLASPLPALAQRALERRAARVLVAPAGDVLALGSRAIGDPSSAMFVLSTPTLYDSTADPRRLRVCRTGAHG